MSLSAWLALGAVVTVLITFDLLVFARGRMPGGSLNLTCCCPSGITSRIGPFIIMGFVRFTR